MTDDLQLTTKPTHASLFTGIGGFDLAAEWIGWGNMFHCEINPFCQKVLKYHFPNSIPYHDIKKTDFTIHRGTIDVLTGGFPCQPYSQAGKRLGKEDERHLWPEMLRAIREIQPGYVVGENVRGLTNWNGGVVFDEVQSDLEAEGYEVLPFLLPACAVNAPHRRDRIWFVAYRNDTGNATSTIGINGNGEKKDKEREQPFIEPDRQNTDTHTNGDGCERINSKHEKHPNEGRKYALNDTKPNDIINPQQSGLEGETKLEESKEPMQGCRPIIANSDSGRQSGKEYGQTEPGQPTKTGSINYWENFPTESPICGRNDGLPSQLDGITFSKWRNESIKGYGNAIVPQVAFELFKVIDKILKNPSLIPNS